MRASRRFEGHIWLAGYSGETHVPWRVDPELEAMGFAGCVELLGGAYGLVAVFELVELEYHLRCYPATIGGAGDAPQWAASYRAPSLHRLAAAALTDYHTVTRSDRLPLFARSEYQRWVP